MTNKKHFILYNTETESWDRDEWLTEQEYRDDNANFRAIGSPVRWIGYHNYERVLQSASAS